MLRYIKIQTHTLKHAYGNNQLISDGGKLIIHWGNKKIRTARYNY